MDTVFSLIIIAAAVGVFLLVLKLLTKPIRFVFDLYPLVLLHHHNSTYYNPPIMISRYIFKKEMI